LVLAALAAGKTSAEAAKEAGCTIQYVYGIVKKRDEPGPVGPARSAGVVEMDKETPVEDRKDPGLPALRIVAERIWPDVMVRVAGRLSRGDERMKIAAKDAWEAADCFRIKARGHPEDVVAAALLIWPVMWRDYAGRGRVIQNVSVSSESAAMALEAAKAFLKHA
jgi:hypothetical protein